MKRCSTACNSGMVWRSHQKGFATAMVLWAVAFIAILLGGVQLGAWRQASAGREALARVRATWAARAGIETVIARLQADVRQAAATPTTALLASIAGDSQGTLASGSWRIEYTDGNGQLVPGVVDAHSKINVNLMTVEDLMLLPDMTEDLAQSIIDYIDADDEPQQMGAESETYASLPRPYKARNGPIHDLAELELVYNVKPGYVRGLDADLNNIIDDAELMSSPEDVSSALSNAGWSAYITADSQGGGPAPNGDPKVELSTAAPSEIEQVLGVNETQATVISAAAVAGGTLESFLTTTMANLQRAQQQAQQQQAGNRAATNRTPVAAELTRQQMAALFDSCVIKAPTGPTPGKLNINTCDVKTLEFMSKITPDLRDAIIQYRDQQSGEVASVVDLLDVPGMTAATLATLVPLIDVRSNVFEATCRGRDEVTGLEVEIVAELDRSTLPVVIRSMRVR